MWEAAQEVPYAYKGNEWLGYDDTKSFKIKVDWVPWTAVACLLPSVALEPQVGPGVCTSLGVSVITTG